ncbi:MAG: endonuclease MutS2 [Chloroflexi bacterium]|nr:endonuclease MutS2 [Chloroflexota bacterium]
MQLDSIRPLEFSQVRARLAEHTAFRASEQLALELEPSADAETVKTLQQETTEARALLDQQPQLSIAGARDVRPLTRAARVGGMIQANEFHELRATLLAARQLKKTIGRLSEHFPRLAFIAAGLNDAPRVVDEIGRVFTDQGEIADGASPELALIRRDLRIAQQRVMDRLNHIITSSQFAKYLQEPIITEREGRYVVPVRAEARGRINGIVHDASASGATLFVEPLAVVELGNRVRELLIREQREIERILRELTDLVAQHADAIDYTVETLAQLDLAFAKAKYSAALHAVAPIIDTGSREQSPYLELEQARHPLLDPDKVVPISLELQRAFSILIITGPNTGGKTVSLKTVGLLALMAQSGLHIPAQEGSRLPVYDGIFADIGDEQSIAQSLSTFSGHLKNIIGILRAADAKSLVLLDELGAGTDPVEGAALARAIVENLLARKIPAMIATHYAELKAFAHTTPGVENASMEFDVETLAPTYLLTIGLPGRSNAFAIATRLGLDRALVERARENVGKRNEELETLLAQLKKAREEALREQSRAAAARETAEKASKQMRRELADTQRQRSEILRHTREQARAELDATRAELNRLKREWREIPATRETAKRAEQDLQALEEASVALSVPPPAPRRVEPAAPVERIRVGDQVYVPSLNQYGEVLAIGSDLVVQIGAFRMNLDPEQVQVQPRAAAAPEPRSQTSVVLPDVDSPGIEVHLRGMRAEEALDKLEKYLDRAYLAGLPYVRIVHGKGTGTLRKLARDFLHDSPLVASIQTAESSEGGEGVTVVKLATRS